MKKIFSIAFSLFLYGSLFAGKGLVITQKYNDPATKGESITVTWYVTETQCKLKMSVADDKINTNTFFIPDVAGAKLMMYSDGTPPAGGKRTYYTMPVQSIKSNIEVSRVSVNKTGSIKTIGGFVCEQLIIKTNRSTTEMWVTKDFRADLYKFYPFFQSSYELLGLNQESIQGVPLESVTKDNGGAIINSYELVSASNSELGNDAFVVPSEYNSADAFAK